MAVGHLTYMDLSEHQRRTGASHAREKLRGLLANPFLTPEQLKALHTQMAQIDAWEAGTLAVDPKPKNALRQLASQVPLKALLPPAPVSEAPVSGGGYPVSVDWEDEPGAPDDE
jgi:hypothetical protein